MLVSFFIPIFVCMIVVQSFLPVLAAGIRPNRIQRAPQVEESASHGNVRRGLGAISIQRAPQVEESSSQGNVRGLGVMSTRGNDGVRTRGQANEDPYKRTTSGKVRGSADVIGDGHGQQYSHEYHQSDTGKGKKVSKQKSSEAVYDADYDEYSMKCIRILDGFWSYIIEESYTEVDVDGDMMISPGDRNTFDTVPVRVISQIDGSVTATATLDGSCTVPRSIVPSRNLCQLVFDFGKAGTVSAQGPLGKMVITGATGCFYWYYGAINGDLLDSQYGFSVDIIYALISAGPWRSD
mmetsp:Transcript_12570/g.24139  ORF Transcript_12570/g.24139 Transcript_12570/m.24139 type:complete len:294 (-) Transcript_12570:49-930(-)